MALHHLGGAYATMGYESGRYVLKAVELALCNR